MARAHSIYLQRWRCADHQGAAPPIASARRATHVPATRHVFNVILAQLHTHVQMPGSECYGHNNNRSIVRFLGQLCRTMSAFSANDRAMCVSQTGSASVPLTHMFTSPSTFEYLKTRPTLSTDQARHRVHVWHTHGTARTASPPHYLGARE